MTLIFRTFVISEVTFAAWTAGIPVLRSAKRTPAYVKKTTSEILFSRRTFAGALFAEGSTGKQDFSWRDIFIFVYCQILQRYTVLKVNIIINKSCENWKSISKSLYQKYPILFHANYHNQVESVESGEREKEREREITDLFNTWAIPYYYIIQL